MFLSQSRIISRIVLPLLLVAATFQGLAAQDRPLKEYSNGVRLFALKTVGESVMQVSIGTQKGLRMEGFIVTLGKSEQDILNEDFNWPFLWCVTTFPDGSKSAEYLFNREGWKKNGTPPSGTYWCGTQSYTFNADGSGQYKQEYEAYEIAPQQPVGESEYSHRAKSGLIYYDRVEHMTGGYYYYVDASVTNDFFWEQRDGDFSFRFSKPQSNVTARIDFEYFKGKLAPGEYEQMFIQQIKADLEKNKDVKASKEDAGRWISANAYPDGAVRFDCIGSNEDLIVLLKKDSDTCDIDNYRILYKKGAEVLSIHELTGTQRKELLLLQ